VSQQHDAIRGALGALRPDDEHPGHERLEAYVEGRLTPEERAEIDRIAARSPVVAEDLADLHAIHKTLVVQPAARRNVRWGRIAAMAAVAAGVVLAIWIGNPRVQAPTRTTIVTADERAAADAAVAAGRITLPESINTLRPREGTLLGASQPARFHLQTPVGTAVLSQRPVFRWDDASADAYTVAVFDQNFSEVARSRVTGTSWSPDVDLPRGSTYSWQVTAHRGNDADTEPKPPRPEARFTIVDSSTAQRVEDLQRRLDANEPLVLGILLAESGLIDDAREHLTRASQLPETAGVARRLLDSLDQGTPITTKPAQ